MSNCFKLFDGAMSNTGDCGHFHPELPYSPLFYARQVHHRSDILITIHFAQAQQVAE
jgi:hypothetical protein